MNMRTDSEIQQAVQRELEWDSRVDHTDIGVSVRNGIVTLDGNVDSWAKRVAAQQAAHRVGGVLDVANDIRVKPPGAAARTDSDVAEAVRLALDWNVFVPQGAIHSTVSNGTVTLDGEVDFLAQRDDAERAIEHLAGVTLVLNNIIVKVGPARHAGDVRQAIHNALERRATRESDRIRVDERDGVVTLSGVCHTWPERKAIVGAARGTPGVRSVHDELRIIP
jgi:osmotically-inducible protein OsmY